jgi:DHA1 family tetracycline resistance protein-like MFS transporter
VFREKPLHEQLVHSRQSNLVSAASAFVADVTQPEGRAARFGMLVAESGAGVVLGPMLVGLLEKFGTRMPFFLAAGLTLLNVLYGYFVLPESLARSNRRILSWVRANPLGAFLQLCSRPQILWLLAALLLLQMASWTVPVIWGYFAILKFGWTKREIGLSLSLQAAALMIVQAILTTPVHRRLGSKRTPYFAACCLAIGLLGFALSTRAWMMLAFIAPSAIGSLARPAIVSFMSCRVPANSQGELQGSVAAAVSVSLILTPLLMAQLFSRFSGEQASVNFPGAPYLAAALLAWCGLAVARHAFKIELSALESRRPRAARSPRWSARD